jgi:hypothetical protein
MDTCPHAVVAFPQTWNGWNYNPHWVLNILMAISSSKGKEVTKYTNVRQHAQISF